MRCGRSSSTGRAACCSSGSGAPAATGRGGAPPGAESSPGESHEQALTRELLEEIGLQELEVGPLLFEHVGQFPWAKRLYRQRNVTYLVRVEEHEPRATVDLSAEGVAEVRWWTLAELAASQEQFAPPDLLERVRNLGS